MILYAYAALFMATILLFVLSVFLVEILNKHLSRKNLLRVRITLMPKTIQVGQTATALIAATGSDGHPFPLTSADQIALVAGTAADVTIGAPTFNADGTASIVVTGVNADASDPITATVDGIQSNSDTLTIEAAPVTLASVSLSLQ